jgi:predicted nucleic acid-binding protein
MTATNITPFKQRAIIDTNVLLRLPQFLATRQTEYGETPILDAFTSGEYTPCICFQSLAEFWAVAGRPVHVNGLGFSVKQVDKMVQRLRRYMQVIPDRPEALDIWVNLCNEHHIIGKKTHDARLISTAIADGVTAIVTFNTADFQHFKDVLIVEPRFATDSQP